MPPRHGKSELVSKYLPGWYLGLNPDHRVILTSYESSFAASWGGKARDILEEVGPEYFGVQVSQTSSAKDHWDIKGHRGGMNTAGAGGPITGKGMSLGIIDDPFKSAKEANSQTIRDAVWDWYRSTFYTRLEPDGVIIVMCTRWHEDDLIGRLLQLEQQGGDHWEVLNLPALAEEDDPLGRTPGQALWRSRFNEERLHQARIAAGPYWWAALYQQRPAPEEGGTFKRHWFQSYRPSPDGTVYILQTQNGQKFVPVEDCWNFATMDLAASLKESADFTVLSTFAVTPQKDLLLLDVTRGHFEGPDHPRLVRDVNQRYNPVLIGIEKTGYQLSLIQQMVREGLPIRELIPDKDKLSRALIAQARYAAGTIYHPETAPWLGDWEQELLQFPNAAHDDQVDTVSYGALVLARRSAEQALAAVRRRLEHRESVLQTNKEFKPGPTDDWY